MSINKTEVRAISDLELAMIFNLSTYNHSEGWKNTKEINQTDADIRKEAKQQGIEIKGRLKDKRYFEEIPKVLIYNSPQTNFITTCQKLVKRGICQARKKKYEDTRGRPHQKYFFRLKRTPEVRSEISKLIQQRDLKLDYSAIMLGKKFSETKYFKEFQPTKKELDKEMNAIDNSLKEHMLREYDGLLDQLVVAKSGLREIFNIKKDIKKDCDLIEKEWVEYRQKLNEAKKTSKI